MIATLALALAIFGDIGLPLTDVPAYKAALETPTTNATDIGFRELWDHPDSHRGKTVSVRGTIAKSFRTGGSGELPARVELWIVTPFGDLICGVFPDAGKSDLPTSEVIFRGTSLGKITYVSGDVSRMAPLIVGSGEPVSAARSPGTTASRNSFTLEAILGIMVAMGVASILVRNHLRKPPRRRVEADLPLEFLDDPAREGGSDEAEIAH